MWEKGCLGGGVTRSNTCLLGWDWFSVRSSLIVLGVQDQWQPRFFVVNADGSNDIGSSHRISRGLNQHLSGKGCADPMRLHGPEPVMFDAQHCLSKVRYMALCLLLTAFFRNGGVILAPLLALGLWVCFRLVRAGEQGAICWLEYHADNCERQSSYNNETALRAHAVAQQH